MSEMTIQSVMTETIHTISDEMSLKEATHMMHQYKIRHLPVQHGGKLVGLISDRDVKLALSLRVDAASLKVSDVMTEDIYSVSPETPLATAVAGMSAHKYGSVVVQNHHGRAIGIFTATDAVRLLAAKLSEDCAVKQRAAGF